MDNKQGDIIQAVEQCLRRNGCSSCENCPYTHVGDGFECREKLRDDIIALLKAQEPRVMSFDEAMLDIDRDVVWIELKDDQIVEPAIIIVATDDSAAVMSPFSDEEDGALKCDRVLCGKTYRCWTSRPSDAQREATPWQG